MESGLCWLTTARCGAGLCLQYGWHGIHFTWDKVPYLLVSLALGLQVAVPHLAFLHRPFAWWPCKQGLGPMIIILHTISSHPLSHLLVLFVPSFNISQPHAFHSCRGASEAVNSLHSQPLLTHCTQLLLTLQFRWYFFQGSPQRTLLQESVEDFSTVLSDPSVSPYSND